MSERSSDIRTGRDGDKVAVLKGAEALGGDWKAVEEASEADKAKMRFFRVEVELP